VPIGQHVDARVRFLGANNKLVRISVPLAWQNVLGGEDRIVGTLVTDLHPLAGEVMYVDVTRSSESSTFLVMASYVGVLS
jgi:hypothetical protein